MLKRLYIQNYALIESLDIELPQGLIVITGETGAGKSILLGAVSILLGGRCDSTLINDNNKNCVVEGEFETEENSYIIRRVITPSGKSRSFVNDEPVTNHYLSELSATLIDIHAQHNHLLLGKSGFQIAVLDSYCGNNSLLEEYHNLYIKDLDLKAQIQSLQASLQQSESEREYREFLLSKLNDASLKDGELEELENKQIQLSNSQEIKGNLYRIVSILDSEESSVVYSFKEAEQLLNKANKIYPQLEELSQRLAACRVECSDILAEVEKVSDSIENNPQKLKEIDERLSLLYSLMKRFGCESVEALIHKRDELAAVESDNANTSEKLQLLQSQLDSNRVELYRVAGLLSERRTKGAKGLSKVLQNSIRDLEIPNAKFAVNISKLSTLNSNGADEVEFLFSANNDKELLPLKRVASGGELSRIMLCIKKIMGENSGMPTMIFDEIDVGVSGRIADKMGNLLSQMGEKMQIIAITHLPQVASKGESHILVYKESDDDSRAKSRIRFIDGQERVMEIARLLSGEKTSNEAIANAKVLLNI